MEKRRHEDTEKWRNGETKKRRNEETTTRRNEEIKKWINAKMHVIPITSQHYDSHPCTSPLLVGHECTWGTLASWISFDIQQKYFPCTYFPTRSFCIDCNVLQEEFRNRERQGRIARRLKGSAINVQELWDKWRPAVEVQNAVTKYFSQCCVWGLMSRQAENKPRTHSYRE